MATRALCSVDGCGKSHYARRYCRNHYHRLRTHGDPLAGKAAQGEPRAWLDQYLSHEGEDCLIWPFARFPNGYAAVVFEGRTTHASSVMCGLACGEAPTHDHGAAHSCGNGHEGCVNPRHLRWATQRENIADSVEQGTRCRGEDQHAAKLTEDAVKAIRASNARQIDLAAKYGVAPETIRRVRKRQAWAWLE